MDSSSFTFLATILILVLLSASLVLRSYILRRRYRRRFQQALSDPFFVDFNRATFHGASQFDPLGLHRSARRLGPKPVLWDDWIHPIEHFSWTAFMPVAARCSRPPPPSTLGPSSQPSTPSRTDPISSHASPPSFFSQLRLPSPFSLTSRPTFPGQVSVPTGPPTLSNAVATMSPKASIRIEKEATTLCVCVLVAMPDASAPVHHRVPDAKGKAVDPLESQIPQQGGDGDPLLPSSPPPRRSGIPDFVIDEERLPLLEFGTIKLSTDWM